MNARFVLATVMLLAVVHAHAQTVDPEVAEALRAISRDINKSLPVQIDREKILETTVAIQRVLIFKYKFTDESIVSDPRFSAQKYISHLRASLGQSTCTDAGTLELLAKGAKFNYLFTIRRGAKIIDFTLDATVCAAYRPR